MEDECGGQKHFRTPTTAARRRPRVGQGSPGRARVAQVHVRTATTEDSPEFSIWIPDTDCILSVVDAKSCSNVAIRQKQSQHRNSRQILRLMIRTRCCIPSSANRVGFLTCRVWIIRSYISSGHTYRCMQMPHHRRHLGRKKVWKPMNRWELPSGQRPPPLPDEVTSPD